MDASQTALHVVRLARSLKRLTGRALRGAAARPVESSQLADAVFFAPFVLLSQRADPAEPILSYANAAARALFSLEDADIGTMPTRLTAAPEDQAARAAFISEVVARGFVDTYAGPRVARDGRTFTIRDATVFNVSALEDGGSGAVIGQAALFSSWTTPVFPSAPLQPIVTHVHVRCLPQHAALFRALTVENARRSKLLERGCLRFDVLQGVGDASSSFTLVEQFADAAAVAAHKTTPHYLRWREAVAPLMAEPRSAVAFETA